MKHKQIVKKSTLSLSVAFLICTCLTTLVLAQQNQQTTKTQAKSSDTIDDNTSTEGWRISDYKPYISEIEDIGKLGKKYGEKMFTESTDLYSRGLDTLDDMLAEEKKLRDIYKNQKYLNERWHWQEIDRKNAQERYLQRLKTEEQNKAITFFTKSIFALDQVKTDEIKKNEKYIEFKSKLFRIYVSTIYDLGSYKPCIPILERYIALRDKNGKDVWAYRYLSNCYAFMESTLLKSKRSTDDEILYYKHKKNESMLKVIELKYGTQSTEFKELKKIIEDDEKKGEPINISK